MSEGIEEGGKFSYNLFVRSVAESQHEVSKGKARFIDWSNDVSSWDSRSIHGLERLTNNQSVDSRRGIILIPRYAVGAHKSQMTKSGSIGRIGESKFSRLNSACRQLYWTYNSQRGISSRVQISVVERCIEKLCILWSKSYTKDLVQMAVSL